VLRAPGQLGLDARDGRSQRLVRKQSLREPAAMERCQEATVADVSLRAHHAHE